MICYTGHWLLVIVLHHHLTKTKAMKKFTIPFVLVAFTMIVSLSTSAQAKTAETKTPTEMKTFVIEREIPDAGKLTAEQLKSISQTSCSVLKEMGPKIQWLHSYVTGNKIYCIYKAENEELVRAHAKKGGFPANSVVQVSSVISPATAEQ
jgi:hypothetical protein